MSGVPVHLLRVNASNVPDGNVWLGPSERVVHSSLVVDKRRAEWRLGRYAAKKAVAAVVGLDPANIEVRSATDGAPEAFRSEEPIPVAISISHSNDSALCVVAGVGVAVGCDLEVIEPRAEAFVSDYFTDAERHMVAMSSMSDRDLVVTFIWSAKESALKAMRAGLRLDTRDVEVEASGPPRAGTWNPMVVRGSTGEPAYAGWARCEGRFVVTLAADPAPSVPTLL
jgi:4'-phosphopantetheinyl transferase